MSKIEKALKRARSGGALQIVHSAAAPAAVPAESGTQSLALTPADVAPAESIGDRAGAALAIGRMREPNPKARADLEAGRIIFPEMPDNDVVQGFRQIRTGIIQKTQGRNAIIMVTSVAAGGGSSYVAMNLGVAFAFDAGKTALVVDCNLRRPAFNRLFPAVGVRGLTDYLEHPDLDAGEILHPVGIERLRVIPAGEQREIPAEYFTSAKMRRFLDGLKQRYRERYIILDAPPTTESADTQILAELCDLVVLVAPYGKVTNAQIEASVKVIDPKKLFGIVFNGVPKVPAIQWSKLLRNSYRVGSRWIAALFARWRRNG